MDVKGVEGRSSLYCPRSTIAYRSHPRGSNIPKKILIGLLDTLKFQDSVSVPFSVAKLSNNNAWLLKIGPIGSPETSVNTNQRRVTSQKSEDLVYASKEAWSHSCGIKGIFGGTDENRVLPNVKQECYNLNAVVVCQSRCPEDGGGVILQNSAFCVLKSRKSSKNTFVYRVTLPALLQCSDPLQET